MDNNREVRSFGVELRVKEDSRKIVGYASVFNSLSEDLGGFREIVRPGAFKKTINEADVRALWNHDANYVLGRNKAGTLEMREDEKGLAIEIDPPDTTWANDLLTSMRRGDINQMSFGFRTVKDKWEDKDKANITRELLEVELFDVSPVTYPAYPQTSVQVRTKLDEIKAAEGAPPVDSSEVEPDAVHSTRLKRMELEAIEKLIDTEVKE